MEKVVIINLGGNAYQLEERGFGSLSAYLDAAGRKLSDNPDRAEIVADLERAIADKCDAVLGPGKTVVSGAEIDRILEQMGPVQDGDADSHAEPPHADQTHGGSQPRKRLYRILEGSRISGVCTGLSAYFDVDVALMRVIFVLAGLVTHGAAVLAYIIMIFVVPTADTAEEYAAAHGLRFSAQELIDQAKARYAEFRAHSRWAWRTSRGARRWRRGSPPRPPVSYGAQILAGLTAPLFALLSAVLTLAMIAAVVSLITTGFVLGWTLPIGMPLWVGLIVIIVVYNVVIWPVRAVRRASYYALGGGHDWFDAWDGLLVVAFMAFITWIAYEYVPVVHAFVQQIPDFWRDPERWDRIFGPH